MRVHFDPSTERGSVRGHLFDYVQALSCEVVRDEEGRYYFTFEGIRIMMNCHDTWQEAALYGMGHMLHELKLAQSEANELHEIRRLLRGSRP